MDFKLLTSWESIQLEIIDAHIIGRNKYPNPKSIRISKDPLYFDINDKLANPLYKNVNDRSIVNTIKYVYWETRAGIFVSIKDNKLEAFIPFANSKFRNDWSHELSFFGVSEKSKHPVKDYLANKKKVLGRSRSMTTNSKYWWANHHFLNVHFRKEVWGTHSLKEYHDMIQATLNNHKVGDTMVVLNKRDHPILRKDLHKPYTFLYKDVVPKINHSANSYAPIITSYSTDEYLDIIIPVVQDWILATDPNSYYPIDTDIPWEEKLEVAFFRGSATGQLKNNQRLELVKLSNEWKNDIPIILDAGITSWNLSDKIDSNGFVHYIIPKEWEARGVSLKSKLPMNEQIMYKYILNVDGHTRPNRTSWILQCGSLMFMVDSLSNDKTWIENVLKPWDHYIPIKSDLSDLREKIEWCKFHDDECKKIVSRAKLFVATYFTRETMTGYMAYTLNRISANKSK